MEIFNNKCDDKKTFIYNKPKILGLKNRIRYSFLMVYVVSFNFCLHPRKCFFFFCTKKVGSIFFAVKLSNLCSKAYYISNLNGIKKNKSVLYFLDLRLLDGLVKHGI